MNPRDAMAREASIHGVMLFNATEVGLMIMNIISAESWNKRPAFEKLLLPQYISNNILPYLIE